MEKLSTGLGKTSTHIGRGMRNITLALGLAMGVSNFSYSQENGGRNIGSTEQFIGQGERNIETYRIRIQDREASRNQTSESLDEFVTRLGNQFDLEVKKNNNISSKINQIKNILNINSNNPILILQTALKTIDKTNKYKGLDEYTNDFSGKFDLNFINAIGYIQFINQLYDGGSLLGRNGELTLNNIIKDLSNEGGYSAIIWKRNNNDLRETNESLAGFVTRRNRQFEYDVNNPNSLISKKISNIQRLLHDKYNLNLNDNKIFIIQSALAELSKTERYKELQGYVENFSGKFDLNLIDACGLVQYINELDCNWVLHGNDGALLLQSLYDDLERNLNNDNNLDRNRENNNEDPNIEPNNRALEGIALLSNNLSLDNLNGITYEDVWNTVNGFRHEGLRNAVMERLLHNDIIGAQRLLGMDLNCNSRRYPDYVAGRKLGHRELELMEKHSEYRRYMDSQEFLSNMEKIERAYEIENYEVKTAYLKFLSGEFDNGGLPYCIISKYDYKIYLFSADHKFLASYTVVTGAHVGNHPNDVGEHLRDPQNAHHTTPGGMYRFGGFFDKSSIGKDLTAVYGTDYGVLEPLEGQYNYTEEYSLGIHGFVMGRERMFYSQDMKDRLASNGCINFLRQLFGEMFNHLKKGSKVYVCRDDEINDVGGFGYNEGEIEMIKHFGPNPQNVIHWDAVVNRGYCKNNTGNTPILPRKILSNNSTIKEESIGSELPYRYNLNFITSSSKTNISNIFCQQKRQPYKQMYQRRYMS